MTTVSTRYIRSNLADSTSGAGNIWTEIQAYTADGTNVALNKAVTASFSSSSLGIITDGGTTTQAVVFAPAGAQSVMVDLGAAFDLESVKLWYYPADGGRQWNEKVEIATNSTGPWTTLYDSAVNGLFREANGHSLLTSQATVPDAPTNVVATAFGGSASVAFTAPGANGSAITGYTVTASPGNITATGTTSPIEVTGLTNGTAYTFTVKATNAIGTGPASAPSAAVTPQASAPQAPTIVSVSPGNSALTVSFNAGATGGSAITSFTATASPGGATATGTAKDGLNALTITGLTNGTNYTIAVTATNAIGTSAPSAPSAATAPIDNGDSTTVVGNISVLVRGIGAGRTFPTLPAFATYIQGVDCVNENKQIFGELYEDVSVGNIQLHTKSSDANRNVTLRCPSSKPLTGYNYNTSGVEITATGIMSVGTGVTVSDIRIETTGGGNVTFNATGPGQQPAVRRARLLVNSDLPLRCTNYAEGELTDSLIVRTLAIGGYISSFGWKVNQRRNTYVLEGAGTALFGASAAWGGMVENCAFSGFDAPIEHATTGNSLNNYTDRTPNDATGLVVDTVNPFFVAAGTDYRPGTALREKGNASAKSINDNLGQNRGLSPDVGAFEFAPAIALPAGSVTEQRLDGSSLILRVAFTGTADSILVTLLPADPANGAVAVGPLPMVLDQVNKTASLDVDDIVGGSYRAPDITIGNAGGTVKASGATPFDLIPVGGLVFDGGAVGADGGGTPPETTLPAPVIAITTADAAVMAGKRATISGSVNLGGDAGGAVAVFLDPQPTGTPLSLGAANVASATWTKQADIAPGLYKLRVVATANGQAAQASTGNIRVLNLVGNFNLPSA